MILIDKKIVASEDVTFSQIGFGRVEDEGLVPYEMEISQNVFFETVEVAYQECISELRRDDSITGEFEAPYPGALDYPSLKDFVDGHMQYFLDFFNTYLKFDFFRSLLNEEDSSCTFILSSFDGIRTDEGNFILFGKARKLPVQ